MKISEVASPAAIRIDSLRPARGLVLAVVLSGVAAGGCTAASPPPTVDVPASPATPEIESLTKTVRIPIEGMSCSACVARIKAGVAEMDGVSGVEVDLAARNARVRFVGSRVSAERIVARINELGYRAGPAVETN